METLGLLKVRSDVIDLQKLLDFIFENKDAPFLQDNELHRLIRLSTSEAIVNSKKNEIFKSFSSFIDLNYAYIPSKNNDST